MAKASVRITGDFGAARLRRNREQAQMILDTQVLKDTTPYVPRDTGTLAQSGQRASRLGSGKLEWDAPHARAQYYRLPNKARDKHPLAVMRWFEHSKSANKAAWVRVAKATGGRT